MSPNLSDSHGTAIGEVALPASTSGAPPRPVLHGTFGMVAAGHYLAAAIGLRMLELGGNAIDAGVAAGFALAILKPQSNGIGGEVPILIHMREAGRSVAINGQGWAPRSATVDWFRDRGVRLIPGDGLLPATVPAAFAAYCQALSRFGTLPLDQVLGPTIELAAGGFPLYGGLRSAIREHRDRLLAEWPSTAAVYLPGGQVPHEGALLRNRDLARTLQGALDAALRARSSGREMSIQAALDHFYSGPIAQEAVRFTQHETFPDATGESHHGLLSIDDWTDYGAIGTRIEEPVRANYRGIDVLKCGSWIQGPVLLQQLKLLEGFDIADLGHNSASYLHVYLEAAKLAFADRERYYGDPAFVDVPLDRLLSDEYCRRRRTLIDRDHANNAFQPGDPMATDPAAEPHATRWPVYTGDTTHVDVVDRWGNLFAATPSGGWFQSSPVIPGLGFPLGTRGQMFWLDERHPNALVPGKRPRTTLSPGLALKNGEPWLAFGTPGGDQQDQWALQFFLNVVDFGMDLQAAIDAPTVHSTHHPGSFYPHRANPGQVHVEGRIPPAIRDELASRGHRVVVAGDWAHGQVSGITYDPATGVIAGGVSPRGRVAYVMGR